MQKVLRSKSNDLVAIHPQDLGDYCIVAAHPDDETLWASSLLRNAKKVIICFSGSPESDEIACGRQRLQRDFPLHNARFFNINEPPLSGIPVKLSISKERRYGLQGHKQEREYRDAFFEILRLLADELRDCQSVFTHSPWGEYGNVEHIQVHKAVAETCSKYSLNFFCFGYFYCHTYSYMLEHLRSSPPLDCLELKTDQEIFSSLKKTYQEYHCWTFSGRYLSPPREFFLLLQGRLPAAIRSQQPPSGIPCCLVREGLDSHVFSSAFRNVYSVRLVILVIFDRIRMSVFFRMRPIMLSLKRMIVRFKRSVPA